MLGGAANRKGSPGSESWTSPLGVVRDPVLTLGARRSILMDRASTEYLIDEAANEDSADHQGPARLREVEQALLALERGAGADGDRSGARKAA